MASISSVGGLRGSGTAPVYNATKVFQINYLEGMRQKTNKLNKKIFITDIRRLAYISEKDVKRLRKYLKAYKQLLGEPTYSVESCRIDHPNAYMPWTQEDDDKLEQLFCEGKTTKELSDIFQRKQGAIRSRVKKLELEENTNRYARSSTY